ncbi:S41 family peptidase [Wenyingzhuangia sp. IMCC45467]
MKKIIIIFITLLSFISCKNEKSNIFKRSFYQSFNIIKEKHIKTDKLNWDKIEKNILDSIPEFRNNFDVYNGVKYVLNQTNDKHSFFLPPNKTLNPLINDSLSVPEVNYKILDNNIGYLKITGFFSNDSLSSAYSFKIRETLKKVDSYPNLSGWILDLRNNVGGKMGMMSLGLAPLYENETIGYSVNNKKEYFEHKLINDAFYYGEYKVNKLHLTDTLFYDNLTNSGKPIAILVNEKTGSAGEATAQSFKFQKNTMIFGTNTLGLTTDVQMFEFVSGAQLCISVAFMCDEKKKIIKEIIPDIKCESKNSVNLAINWIKNAI